ncbi:PREDICTED: uncharacterized protein LOC102835709 [Chrysochloris asiatica]|uniref:Uncharacterized protein LOC102835709 n=1 Tax=Chrysochloris asiatica TaxID=185453 RepID=A0A9B0TKU0_CHRAS|nr:PREDICTED: uncharacterized protein LOC102835709 [Chrysochloris asiatica]
MAPPRRGEADTAHAQGSKPPPGALPARSRPFQCERAAPRNVPCVRVPAKPAGRWICKCPGPGLRSGRRAGAVNCKRSEPGRCLRQRGTCPVSKSAAGDRCVPPRVRSSGLSGQWHASRHGPEGSAGQGLGPRMDHGPWDAGQRGSGTQTRKALADDRASRGGSTRSCCALGFRLWTEGHWLVAVEGLPGEVRRTGARWRLRGARPLEVAGVL